MKGSQINTGNEAKGCPSGLLNPAGIFMRKNIKRLSGSNGNRESEHVSLLALFLLIAPNCNYSCSYS